jgi:protein SCO1/2
MNEPSERLSRTLWIGVGLLIVILAVAAVLSRVERGRAVALPVLGSVADFTLTNQNGQAVTLAELRGHVWVTDIIFTSCAGPCPRMTKQMKALQSALTARKPRQTRHPDDGSRHRYPDGLENLRRAFRGRPGSLDVSNRHKKGDRGSRHWQSQAHRHREEARERENPQDLFIHSTIFVVVDKQARLRGVFETEGEGVNPIRERDKIIAAVQQLERER